MGKKLLGNAATKMKFADMATMRTDEYGKSTLRAKASKGATINRIDRHELLTSTVSRERNPC